MLFFMALSSQSSTIDYEGNLFAPDLLKNTDESCDACVSCQLRRNNYLGPMKQEDVSALNGATRAPHMQS